MLPPSHGAMAPFRSCVPELFRRFPTSLSQLRHYHEVFQAHSFPLHGMAKAINWLTERLQQDGQDFRRTTLFVSYIIQEESAAKLLEQLRAQMQLGEVIFSQIGPTVGTHLGPGCVALFYLTPPAEE